MRCSKVKGDILLFFVLTSCGNRFWSNSINSNRCCCEQILNTALREAEYVSTNSFGVYRNMTHSYSERQSLSPNTSSRVVLLSGTSCLQRAGTHDVSLTVLRKPNHIDVGSQWHCISLGFQVSSRLCYVAIGLPVPIPFFDGSRPCFWPWLSFFCTAPCRLLPATSSLLEVSQEKAREGDGKTKLRWY